MNENYTTFEDEISRVFFGVKLDDGIDIYTAQSKEEFGSSREKKLARLAERFDWQKVLDTTILARGCAITFLDAAGLRFYSPPIMRAIFRFDSRVNGFDDLVDTFINSLRISETGHVKDSRLHEIFTQPQQAVIVKFLRYLDDLYELDCDAHIRIKEYLFWARKH